MIALGCIADDFTGGTDVAAGLRRGGMSVALLFGVPEAGAEVPSTDAVVIALKTRTVPAAAAVDDSLRALSWLKSHDVGRVYFKYCSTFDSTDEGNIGPVADALLRDLGESMTLICPSSPEHARTTYNGYHFVGHDLLSESSMRFHPLTPMTDAKLARVLQPQTDGLVGHLTLDTVHEGIDAVAGFLAELETEGVRHVVVDSVTDADLYTVAAGSRDLRLLTGGAGLAAALGSNGGGAEESESVAELPSGPGIVLAGSCSAATMQQVSNAAGVFLSYRLDPSTTPDPVQMQDAAVGWLRRNWEQAPVLIYSSAGPEDRERARAAMGSQTSEILERTLGALAAEAVSLGAQRVVVAGGETSGAVVQALGISTVVIQSEADRGVPWCLTTGEPTLALLLKSGNFGSADLLVRAMSEGGS